MSKRRIEHKTVTDLEAVRTAWRDHLAGRPWSHFVHLTTREVWTSVALQRAFQRYVQRLSKAAGVEVQWFFAIEGGACVQPHVHALLGGTIALPLATIRGEWKGGITDAEVYDAGRGGAGYASKSIASGAGWYDISPHLPAKVVEPEPLRVAATGAQSGRVSIHTKAVPSTETLDIATWADAYIRRVIALAAEQATQAAA